MISDNVGTNVCFEEIIVNPLKSQMKGDPSKLTLTTQTQIIKIKDLSRLKCHKEMKDT